MLSEVFFTCCSKLIDNKHRLSYISELLRMELTNEALPRNSGKVALNSRTYLLND